MRTARFQCCRCLAIAASLSHYCNPPLHPPLHKVETQNLIDAVTEEEERLITGASVKKDGGYAEGRNGETSGTDREHLATVERKSRGGGQLQGPPEKHVAEVNGNLAEVPAAFKKASKESSDARNETPKHRARGSQADGLGCQQRQRNNAFSILLVRVNTSVPITRVGLGSGSWREAIRELVGCPDDKELTTVRNNRERGTE